MTFSPFSRGMSHLPRDSGHTQPFSLQGRRGPRGRGPGPGAQPAPAREAGRQRRAHDPAEHADRPDDRDLARSYPRRARLDAAAELVAAPQDNGRAPARERGVTYVSTPVGPAA